MIALGALAWCAGAVALALYLGRVLRDADCCPHDDLGDHFDGVPVECLSPVEVDRRFHRITSTFEELA